MKVLRAAPYLNTMNIAKLLSSICCILFAFSLQAQDATNAPAQPSLRDDFQQMLARWQREGPVKPTADSPLGNDDMLEYIIDKATQLNPPPEIPEEARKHFIRAVTLQKTASQPSDYDAVIKEYDEVERLAPWWGEPWFNCAVALESEGKYQEAIRCLNFYLLTKPSGADATGASRKIQDDTYSMQAMQDKATTEKEKSRFLGKWYDAFSNSKQVVLEVEKSENGQLNVVGWRKTLNSEWTKDGGQFYLIVRFDDGTRQKLCFYPNTGDDVMFGLKSKPDGSYDPDALAPMVQYRHPSAQVGDDAFLDSLNGARFVCHQTWPGGVQCDKTLDIRGNIITTGNVYTSLPSGSGIPQSSLNVWQECRIGCASESKWIIKGLHFSLPDSSWSSWAGNQPTGDATITIGNDGQTISFDYIDPPAFGSKPQHWVFYRAR
jgi:hypothetical protein